MLKAKPESYQLRLGAAEAQIRQASTYYYNDKFAQVYPLVRIALISLESLREKHPEDPETLRLIGKAHVIQSMTLSWDGKQAEGEVEMARAFSVNESLVAKHPRDHVLKQDLLEVYLQSSQLYEGTNDARSFELLCKARDLAEEAARADTANIQARQNLAKVYSRLGLVALRLQRIDEALDYLKKSSTEFAALQKIDPSRRTYQHDIGRVLLFLGQANYEKKNFPGALDNYARAASLFEDIVQADPQNNLPVEKLAQAYKYTGDAHRDFAKTLVGPNSKARSRGKRKLSVGLLMFIQGWRRITPSPNMVVKTWKRSGQE